MKKILSLFVCLASVLTLVSLSSCGDDDEKRTGTLLTASVDRLEFTNNGGEQSFTVESNTSWSISSSSSYITATPSQGNGTQTVTVKVTDMHNAQDANHTLTIRSTDGAKMLNVTIVVKGSMIEGKDLRFLNAKNQLYLGGKANAEELMVVASNVQWELRGSEWLEAWDGSRWRALSPTRGVITGGNTARTEVRLRTASANMEFDNRQGFIALQEQLTGDVPYHVEVSQLGKENVAPCRPWALADAFCTNWVTGNDVKAFYCLLSDKQLSEFDTSDEMSYLTYPDYTNWWTKLKENTRYYLYSRAIKTDNTISDVTGRQEYVLPSSWNQARATIEKAYLTDEGWYIDSQMNDLASGYLEIVYTNKNLFNYPAVYLTWLIKEILLVDPNAMSDYGFSESGRTVYDTKDDILALTWATDKNANWSNVVDMFNSTKDAERRASAESTSSTQLNSEFGGMPVTKLPKSIKVRKVVRK